MLIQKLQRFPYPYLAEKQNVMKGLKSVLLFILGLTLLIPSVKAQKYVNILNLNSSYYPASSYKLEGKTESTVTKPLANLRIPIVLKNENVILVGANGLMLDNTVESTSISNDRIFATNAYAGYQHQFNEKWSAVFVGLVKVNSDGLFVTTYKYRENLDLKAGWYYGQEFFGAFTFPFFGLNWEINDRTYLSATFPSIAELEYEISKFKLYTGVRFQNQTESMRLTETGNYVKFTETNLRAFLDAYITKNLTAYIGAGVSANRQYSEYLLDQKDEEEFLAAFSLFPWQGKIKGVSPMIEAGLAFRVRLDREEE